MTTINCSSIQTLRNDCLHRTVTWYVCSCGNVKQKTNCLQNVGQQVNCKQLLPLSHSQHELVLIVCVVPQMYIPMLFLLYINDLYNVCCDFVPLFLLIMLIFPTKVMKWTSWWNINCNLENRSLWSKMNKLSLNVKIYAEFCYIPKGNIHDVPSRRENWWQAY